MSDHGRVRSLDRIVHGKDGRRTHFKGKILAQRLNSDGYAQIQLSCGDKVKTLKVHRMVAEAFIPNPDSLPEVNHRDENKTNNLVNNLEWCTHLYNARYGTRGARISHSLGHPVLAYLPGSGLPVLHFGSFKAAAAHFGVTAETVRQAAAKGWRCRGYNLLLDKDVKI